MKFFAIKKFEDGKCEAAIFPFWQEEGGKKPSLPSWAGSEIKSDEFLARAGQILILRNAKIPSCPSVKKALLLGLGERAKANPVIVCSNYANAFLSLKAGFLSSISVLLPSFSNTPLSSISHPQISKNIFIQILMSDYLFDKYKPTDEKSKEPKPEVQMLEFVCPETEKCEKLLGMGKIIADASNFARSMQNEPANVATPEYISSLALKIAKEKKLKCKIYGRGALEKMKMNAMLSVASGSKNEPRLAVLEYRGNPSKKGWDVALVGKGVTFDSGGISLKPANNMDEMKFDKSGACACIGAISACPALGINKNVVAIAALVENMPSGDAYKPGDIVKASNGTTIEVLNTDAEGRVILADALAFASSEYSPSVIIDLATLTGACTVALGDLAAGLLCDDDALCSKIYDAGMASGERVWRLPTWTEYDEKIKSDVASIKNTGEPGVAGTITGAVFLRNFVGDKKWAHIDIAGVANIKKPKWGLGIGGTGFGVRLLLEYLQK